MLIILTFLIRDELNPKVESLKEEISELSFQKKREKIYPVATNLEKIDWHDWNFIEYEKSRTGPGEQGRPFRLTDKKDKDFNKKLFRIEGLSAVVSDKISVNRSVPDIRHPK